MNRRWHVPWPYYLGWYRWCWLFIYHLQPRSWPSGILYEISICRCLHPRRLVNVFRYVCFLFYCLRCSYQIYLLIFQSVECCLSKFYVRGAWLWMFCYGCCPIFCGLEIWSTEFDIEISIMEGSKCTVSKIILPPVSVMYVVWHIYWRSTGPRYHKLTQLGAHVGLWLGFFNVSLSLSSISNLVYHAIFVVYMLDDVEWWYS